MSTESHDYLKERLEDQITWHSKKSRESKKKFYFYQVVILISSAIVPIVNVFNGIDLLIRIISAVLGSMIAVITGLTQLAKYQENWILYRTTVELLKKEKFMFLNDAGDYSNLSPADKKKLLVTRVETIVSSETSKYFAIHQPQQSKAENQSQ